MRLLASSPVHRTEARNRSYSADPKGRLFFCYTVSVKKILIFSLAYYPKHVGGAEVAIKEITDRIPRDDIEFHLVCLRFDAALPRTEQVGNVLVHRIGPTRANPTMADLKRWPLHVTKHLYQFYAPLVAWRLHRRYSYDAAWAMMAHSCGVPVVLFNLLTGVPFVQTLQEGDPPEYIEKLARPVWPLFRRAFTNATVIQTISTFLARWAERMGARCPIEVVPNAVNTQHFSQSFSPEELTRVREQIGKRTGEVCLVTTSRLVHKNAIDDVIRALPLLPERVTFVVYGIGPDEEKLKTLTRELRLDGRVRFMGQIGHGDMPRALKACDIFIRPSRSEGMGNSFVEAMAAELPIIATQEGGIADFLFDERLNPEHPTTGWAVRKDTPEDIAAAVHDILARPEKVREVVENAKKLAFAKYDWDLIARDMRERVFARVERRKDGVKS